MLRPRSFARLWAPKRDVALDEGVQSLGVLVAEFSGAGSMVAGGPFFLLPIFNARSHLLRRGLEMLEIGVSNCGRFARDSVQLHRPQRVPW